MYFATDCHRSSGCGDYGIMVFKYLDGPVDFGGPDARGEMEEVRARHRRIVATHNKLHLNKQTS